MVWIRHVSREACAIVAVRIMQFQCLPNRLAEHVSADVLHAVIILKNVLSVIIAGFNEPSALRWCSLAWSLIGGRVFSSSSFCLGVFTPFGFHIFRLKRLSLVQLAQALSYPRLVSTSKRE